MKFLYWPMVLRGMLAAVVCGVSFAVAHPGHGKDDDAHHPLEIPQVTRVDAQPLILQCQRLTEALDSIGASLPADTAASLKKLTALQDDAEITRKVQDLLDPQCIATLEIGADGKLVASPALNGMELEENGFGESHQPGRCDLTATD
jgi:hypothetical protein